MNEQDTKENKAPRAWLKPAIDYGPLAAFFLAYLWQGLMTATAVIMVAVILAVIAARLLEGRWPLLPLITAGIVGLFGGLTLYLNDETFIKMKPTIIEALFSLVLFGGLLFKRPLLKPVLGAAWKMEERGWILASRNFAIFFAAMAILNEVVWRNFSTDLWVNFKVFGLLGLTLAFSLVQALALQRYMIQETGDGDDSTP